jgi:uncharacterized protein (TIGR02569 family)
VLEAFAADGVPVPLGDPRRGVWRVGTVVLKQADDDEEAIAWVASTFASIGDVGVRLAAPRRSRDGRFDVAGWRASDFLAGEHAPGRWLDIVAAGERLHAALGGVACPDFVRRRADPWAVADRVAWDEEPLDPYIDVPHVDRLARAREPMDGPRQPIHGDLTGNVMFADPLPPAIIDLSVYCRPARYATAIVIADALVWEGATLSGLGPAMARTTGQLLIRALLFRILTDRLLDPDRARSIAPSYASAVDIATDAARHEGAT